MWGEKLFVRVTLWLCVCVTNMSFFVFFQSTSLSKCDRPDILWNIISEHHSWSICHIIMLHESNHKYSEWKHLTNSGLASYGKLSDSKLFALQFRLTEYSRIMIETHTSLNNKLEVFYNSNEQYNDARCVICRFLIVFSFAKRYISQQTTCVFDRAHLY